MPASPHTLPDPGFQFASRRAPVFAKGGMVAASQPYAVSAGLDMLRQGGSAADAAVAVAAALAVTEPPSTGLGGDAFALYFDAATGKVSGLNGSGRSPAALSFGLLHSRGLDSLPWRSALSVTVPGGLSAWCALLERFGRLPMDRVLAPAVALAGDGFAVEPVAAALWAEGADEVLRTAAGGTALLPGGRAPRMGELVRNPALARTLAALAGAGGARAAHELFYRGPLGAALAAAVQAAGGVLTEADMAAHEAEWAEPVSTVYRGVRVYECAPNGQGLAALLALNILAELDDPCAAAALSPQRLHLLIEAMRLAFADAGRYIADPALSSIPVRELLGREYARERARLVDPRRANPDARAGVPLASSDTVQFCVVDARGNACSMVNSVYRNFGTGIVPQELGFALQNRGDNFSSDPGHPNALGPSKRTYHTIIPGMAVREADGALYAPFGCMGGFMQPQGHVQLLTALLDDGVDPQTAVDRPRFCIGDGTAGGAVSLEEGMPEATVRGLAAMGHDVKLLGGYGRALFGRGQIILRDPETDWLCAGSDPRADGLAMGL